jgi:hypothetical protein
MNLQFLSFDEQTNIYQFLDDKSLIELSKTSKLLNQYINDYVSLKTHDNYFDMINKKQYLYFNCFLNKQDNLQIILFIFSTITKIYNSVSKEANNCILAFLPIFEKFNKDDLHQSKLFEVGIKNIIKSQNLKIKKFRKYLLLNESYLNLIVETNNCEMLDYFLNEFIITPKMIEDLFIFSGTINPHNEIYKKLIDLIGNKID